ncbi:uncharacterized protein LOC129291733 [Prosopis cineraria]|uniref:uncharacterized protein LOC129291733 n=1 Tax=Prosopis cineraria TaxID=364024 RepID=UPI0024103F2A|nr:uncharacterized protein LOC129291733 [Prosopis cineraria]
MASSRLLAFLAVVVIFMPMAAKGGPLDDILDKVCDQVECGKGKCVVNTSLPLNFICECDSGWKRTKDYDNNTYANNFLPCVIPECSLDYGCQSAPPPVPDREYPYNLSAFDPCYWAYCGEGHCTRNRTRTHSCECDSDYFNLLNISVFPCYSSCTIGSDCSRLGIRVADSTSSDGGEANPAISIRAGRLYWMVMLLLSTGVVMWN